ncbi:MAG: transporter substrate-binding domain-containing protein [Eggerthellaceae bacterium]|nr:transporter substrate-binding domain-containing protein [Eggerthellaceae bacterium]
MKKIKFVAAFVAALAIAAFVLAGCSSGASGSAASSASGSDSASSAAASSSASSGASEGFTLVVGFDAEYPPYGFLDADGNPTGFDIDLAKAVCEKMGWGFEAKPIDWNSKDLELESGNINCIWNGFSTLGRDGQYQFSKPYMLNEQVVVVKADSDIKALADLAGKKVITQAGAPPELILGAEGDMADLGKSFDGGAVQVIPEYNSAFMQLESGAIDAVACDISIAEYQMAAAEGKYVVLDEHLSPDHYAVGFKLGEAETAQAVSDALLALYEDGTVKTLCDKYDDISFDNWVLVD